MVRTTCRIIVLVLAYLLLALLVMLSGGVDE